MAGNAATIGGVSVSRWAAPVGASLMGIITCVAVSLALSAAPALAAGSPECPTKSVETAQEVQIREETERHRTESNIDPAPAAGGKTYSQLLPECRAYEMVSPLYKQGHDAKTNPFGGFAVAPGGTTMSYVSEGAFAGVEQENFRIDISPLNPYLAQRGESGWTSSSAFAPSSLVDVPFLDGLDGDSSLDLHSTRVSCGSSGDGEGESNGAGGQSVGCARIRAPGGSWEPNPSVRFTDLSNTQMEQTVAYLGGSSDLSRVFVQPEGALLPSDTLPNGGGIYEIAGPGTAAPRLRLVNVENEGDEKGRELVLNEDEETHLPPLFGDFRVESPLGVGVVGTKYHAISESGETVFFTATPQGSTVQALYARAPCLSGPHCAYVESENEGRVEGKAGLEGKVGDGEGPNDVKKELTGRETIKVSSPSPSECEACRQGSEPQPATFQGASADGSKVFFTTKQQLLSEDSTYNLYEYDFTKPEGRRLVRISAPDSSALQGESAEAAGVVRISSDGSHVYFIAAGVLTTKPNSEEKVAQKGSTNLYAYDTVTEELKFVATAGIGSVSDEVSFDRERLAQTTPDGRDLVFSSTAKLAGDTSTGRAVYLYDFGEPNSPGTLTWISHDAPGFTTPSEPNEAKGAYIAPPPNGLIGGDANIDDWDRAITGCPSAVSPQEGEVSAAERKEREECPEHKYDGEDVIFGTAERLQANDVNRAPDVYEWHCAAPCRHPAVEGVVEMISDGRDPQGVGQLEVPPASGHNQPEIKARVAAISATGSDILFSTHTQLVGQDTDILNDVYDARVDGGFPEPPREELCAGEVCPELETPTRSFPSAPSSLLAPGGNLPPPGGEPLAFKTTVLPPLTQAQKLAAALKVCKKKPKRKQKVACESQARKKYHTKAPAKSKARGK